MEEIKHPCFDRKAHCRYGRLHLPVAPKCNIQCVFCKREFDCMNESRPGVTSRVLSPEEALERTEKYLKLYPETEVIGIAGPGEPLANEETFETLELLRREHSDRTLCLSTNGLYLPEKAKRLRNLGLRYLTVTVNAVSEECAGRIYTYVSDHGRRLTGREGARLLLKRQEEGVRKAVENGLYVKINMVLMEGINTGEISALAEKVSGWGVKLMNMNSVINVTGDPSVCPVPGAALRKYRKEAESFLPQMDFCRQCRADAAGVPGFERQTVEAAGEEK